MGLSAQNGDGHGQQSGKSPYELLKSTQSRWFKTAPGQKVESGDRLGFCDLGITKDAALSKDLSWFIVSPDLQYIMP